MSISDTLLPEFDQEMKGLRKLLERVPDGKSDWKPHEKSMPLARLATHLAELPEWVTNTVAKDVLEFTLKDFVPRELHTTAERLAMLETNVKTARAALSKTKDAAWPKPWSLKVDGKIAVTMPRSAIYRSFAMNHMVHHRAQLGVYLRMLGVPLPPLYGPTADERPAM